MIQGAWNLATSSIGGGAPLSETSSATLNLGSPSKKNNIDPAFRDEYEVTMQMTVETESEGPPSSPFVTNIAHADEDCENTSPSKASRQSSRSPVDREPSSPLKVLKSRVSPSSKDQSPTLKENINTLRSPRKMSSPEKRFPVRPSVPAKQPSPEKKPVLGERTMSIEDVLRDNEGLTKAIEILEDEESMVDTQLNDTLGAVGGGSAIYDETNMDDTMVSTFSNFSAVPDMTTFARIGQSPTKLAGLGITPGRNPLITTPAALRRPAQERSPSPTPRGHKYIKSMDERNNTNLILDFTDQFSGFAGRVQYSPRRQSLLKGTSRPEVPTTPTLNRHNISNLLDFDIPPAPTPRSMPTITPRELESLKSNFLSEISNLKASLSGKTAEVESLKTAVGDAEKRVGESLEQVREEKNMKNQLAAEKEEWEKRSREMEAVLRNVKEEIVHGERERDELEGRLEESERRRDAAEMMAQEAESKMAAMKAGKPSGESGESRPTEDCECGGKAVDIAVDRVSRELHALYKGKHETKVTALKKSYEKRWEKKVRDLEIQIEDLSLENEQIKLGRDTTMTKVEPKNLSAAVSEEDLEKQAAKDAKAKEMEAELEGLTQIVKSVKHDNAKLRQLLDEERVEKGKLSAALEEMIPLVAACDEMLSNQMETSKPAPAATPTSPTVKHSNIESLRGSVSRASGLRAPGSMAQRDSRIGRGGFGMPAGKADENRSGSSLGMRPGSGMGMRPGSGLGYRSGIMSSIEKMGNHKGRGGE